MKRFLTCALSGVFFIWLPNAFADDNGGLLADTPSHIRQAQGDHKVLLTLRADNIQVRAEWRVKNAAGAFDISAGVLSRSTVVVSGTQVATIYVEDKFDLLNESYANLTASAVITVVFLGDTELQLSDAPRLTAVAGKALSLHTFVATGGSEGKTYTLVAGGDGHFVLDEASGVLSLRADAEPDIYTLTVEARDDADDIDEAVATVEVSAALALSDAPPFTVIASVGMSLHTFVASGGIGAPTYTILMAKGGHFDLNAASGVLSLTAGAEPDTYALRIQVKDARDNTAEAMATVEVSAVLSLAAVSLLEAIEGKAVSLHMFSASGGIGIKTYTLAAGDEDYFSVDVGSGVLSLSMNAKAEKYTLTVQVVDARNNTAQAVATVAVSAALELAAASPFTVIASVAMSLHTFVADGGIGSRTYTLAAGDEDYFSVDASSGVLSLLADAEVGRHTLTVQVMDARDNTAETVATVEVSAALALADAPSFTVIASVAMSLHAFIASGGIGSKTYTLLAGDERYFSVDVGSGVLSLSMNAKAEKYTLTVQVMDARNNTAQAVATVAVSAALELAAASPFTVIASVAMSLHTFVASGGIGSRTYTLAAGDKDYFSVDASSGVLSLSMNVEAGRHLLTVQVMDARDNTAQAVATVAVSAALELAAASPFTVIASVAMSLHTFVADGGIGSRTYTLAAGDEDYFSVDASSGVLSLLADAEVGRHLLTVQVMDARDNTAQAVATVEVSAALALAAAPSFTVIASVAMSLHTFVASGGIGSRTYTLLAGDERYFSVGAGSGVLSLSMNAELGSHTLTVQVMDARDNTAQAVATVEVSAALSLSDAPPFTVIISAALSLHTFIASGGIGTPTYAVVSDNEKGGFTLNAASGVLSLQADAEPNTYVLRIQAMDGRDNTAETVVTVGVSAVLALADAPRLGGAQGIEISLHTFAAQGGIGSRTYTLLTDDVEDYFSLGAESGVLSLLAAAPVAIYTLSVQVRDDRGNVANALATVGVDLLFLADAPQLYAIVGREVSLHTFDAKGVIGTLTYTITEGNVNSYFNLDTKSGVLSVKADAPIGIYTLLVSVSDARSSAKALAVVEVRASLSLVAMPPLTVIVGRVAHTLAASGGIGTHTYAILSGDEDGGFALDAASGVLSLSVNAALGQATLTLQVADERANTVQAVATVEVSAALALSEVSLLEAIAGNALSLHIFVADGGIGSRTYTLLAGDDRYFSVGAGNGVLSLSAGAAVGRHTLTVQVMDGRDNTAQALATVGVSAVLALAEAPSFTVIASVGMSLHTFIASGGIGVKTYTLVADDDGKYFSVDTASGVLSLSVNAPIKKYMLTVQVKDERDNTAEALAVVEVSAALSLASAPSFTVIAGVAMSLHTFAASGGIGIRTYTLVSVKELGYFAVDALSGALSLLADARDGLYTLTVGVKDGRDNTAEALAVVEVSAALSLADAPSFTVIASVALSLHTFVADGGIGIKTYTLVSGNELGYFAVDAVGGVLSLRADATVGVYTLTVGVKDERDNTAEALALVEVSAALSLAGAPSFTVAVGVALSLHTFAASGGIGIKTYTLVSGNELGYFAVDAVGGALSLLADARDGLYTLTVGVKDERDNTAEALAVVEVSAVLSLADAPSFTVIASVALSLHTFVADGGIGIKTYTLVSDNELGYFAVDAVGGVLSLRADATVGVYTLTVQAMDEHDNTAEALAVVEVSAALSLASAPPFTVAAGVALSLHTFAASGGIGINTYTLVSGNELGYFAVDAASGALSMTEVVAVGLYTLSVEVSDKAGNQSSVPVTVDVLPPLFVMDTLSFSARVGQAVSLYTFSTTDRVAQTYILAAGNEEGYFSLDAGWVLSVSNQATVGMYQLLLEGSDSAGNQATAVVRVRIIRDGIFVLGGQDDSSSRNDAWSSVDGKSWMREGNGGWSARYGHQAVVHQGRLYVLGGTGLSNDVWSLVSNRWESAGNADWSARWFHQAVSHNGRLYVLGGNDDLNKNDVWSSTDGQNWVQETAEADWPARWTHQAVSHNGRLYVLGGFGDGGRRNDVWSSADGKSWRQEKANNSIGWSARWYHQAVSHHGRLYMLGGQDNFGNKNDVWSSADGKRWREEKADNNIGWSVRQRHQVVSYKGRLYVLGGHDNNANKDDVWSSVDGQSWSLETSAADWVPRGYHQAVAFPPPLILLGTGARLRLTVGLSSANIYTFQTQYGADHNTYSLLPAEVGFSIDNHGVLSADGNTPMGSYTLIVRVEDETGMSAKTEAHVDVALPASPLLTVLAGEEIYTFTVGGGIGEKTYGIVAGNDAQYFTLGGASGKLSVRAEAEVGKYILQVKIGDSRGDYAAGAITVRVAPPLSLAGVSLTSWARLPIAVTLHNFAVSSGIGTKGYALAASNDAGYFALDEISGVLSLPVNPARLVGNYTLSVVVSDSAVPPYRVTAVAAVRLMKNAVIVLGGITDLDALSNDVWSSFDGRSWRQANNSAGWLARERHQALPHNGRLYVLGGDDGTRRNDVWSSFDGRSWRQEKANNNAGWSARKNHQAVSHNGRLYVLGGFDGARKKDVWSSADGKSWTLETGSAGWSSRERHRAVSHNGRLYVLGGFDGSVQNDVWSSVDGKSWRQETAAAWPARRSHQVVSHNERLYVLGGATDKDVRKNDVWSSADGKSWRQEKANNSAGWGKRRNHQAVSYEGRLYVLGGFDGGRRNDVWSSADGRSWVKETAASWSGRQDHQAVVFPSPLALPGVNPLRVVASLQTPNIHTFAAQYGLLPYTYSLSPAVDGFSIDESHGVLSADGNALPGNYVLTVWVKDEEGARAQTEVYIEVVTFDQVPLLFAMVGRAEVIYTFDTMNEMNNHTYSLVAGNGDGYFSLGASGALSVTEEAAEGLYTLSVEISDAAGSQTSALVTVDVLPPLFVADFLSFTVRMGKAVSLYTFSTTDRVGAQTYILAGNDEGYFSLDAGWVLSVSSAATVGMYQLRLEGSDSAGNQATAVVRVRIIRDGIFVLGGLFNVSVLLNDVWLSADGNSWTPEGNGDWSARNGHQAVVHQGRLYVLGGKSSSGARNDVWSLVSNSWIPADNADWSVRIGHQAVSHNGRLYVLGGFDGGRKKDVWSSADGTIWSQETAAAGWSARREHQAVSHQGRLYVLGGIDGSPRNDVWSSVDGKSWRQETAAAAWPERARHQAVSHQGRLYVLGGFDSGFRNDVWSSVDGKSWRQETAAAAWAGRYYHQAVSYNGRLYVLGGLEFDVGGRNDVWSSVDGTSWSREADASWSGRQEHQAVVFPQSLVLLGAGTRFRLTVGLSSSNIYTFQARYGTGNYTYSLSPMEAGFSIDNHGVLSADGNTPMGSYTLTAQVEDETGSLAQIALPVEVVLPALPLLTAIAGKMIYTFTVGGGIGEKTYAIADGDGAQYFTLGGASGKLSARAEAEVGKYTLQVKISDSRGDYAAGPVTVEVVPPLSLAGVSLTGWARLSVAVTLHDFAISSGVGAKGYTLVAGNDAGYFALDEISGVLSLPVNQTRLAGDYTLFLAVSDSDEPPNRATAMVKVRLAKNGIFVLGGRESQTVSNDLQNDVWSSANGTSWREETAEAAWPARWDYQVVPHRGRLYVLGGDDDNQRLNDVWSSADGKSWREETAEAAWPARWDHQVVPHRGRLYVLGGDDGSNSLNDVWSSADGKSWMEETAAAAWTVRSAHRVVSHRGRLYVLGGYDGRNSLNDVWSSADGKSWREETAEAWPVRAAHQAVSHRGRLYVLGGYDGSNILNDVWSSADGKSWTEETAAAGPARFYHQAVSRDGLLYVLGGDDAHNQRHNDVWSSADGKSWTEETAAAWSARGGHQAVVFPSPLVLFGVGERIRLTVGMSSSNVAAFQAHYGVGEYTYSLSPAAVGFSIDNHGVLSADGNTPMGPYTLTVWVDDEEGSSAQTELPVEVALPELPLLTAFAGKLIYTFTVSGGIGEKTYVIEEGDGAQYFTLGGTSGKLSTRAEAEVGKYTLQVKISDSRGDYAAGAIAVEVLPPLSLAGVSLTSWARLSVAVTLHGFVASSGVGAKRYTFVAGNDAGYFALDEISGVLSLPVNRARLAGDYTLSLVVSDSNKLPNRVTVVVQVRLVKNGVFMLGGNDGTRRNDVWWSADGKSWTEEAAAAWLARERHQALPHNGRLYVLGGYAGTVYLDDVWSSADGKSWREETAAAAWPARYSHQVVSHRGRLYVLGGYSSERLGDVWSSADGKSWTEETAAAWSARTYHQAVSYRGRLYVLGGYDGTRRNDVWWSADGKSWTEETAAAWPARSRHQAVVHNGRLYVLGGDDGSNSLNDVWSSADGKNWREETAAAWPERSSHQAVVHNGRLYVLGGLVGYGYRNDVWWSADGKSWTDEPAAAWSARQEYQAVVFPSPLALSGGDERLRLTVGMSSFNVATFQAHYGGGAYTYSLSPAEVGFSIDNHGVLSADGNTPMGSYTLTVWVDDEEGSSAQTELPVEVALPELPLLTAFAGKLIYTFTVSGGIGEKTYVIEEGDGAQYFTLGGASGKLSTRAEAEAGKYTLQVKISDSRGDYAARAITVEVVSLLSLAEMSLIGWARLSVAVTLHGFAASSGVGAKRYTLVAGNDAGYFALDEISGVLSLPVNPAMLAGDYTLSLAVSDSDEPPNRATAMVQVRLAKNGFFVLGGYDGTRRNDVWWSADGKSWREETAAAWSARRRHQAVSHRGRLYVLGGFSFSSNRNDVWWSADGKSWRKETAEADWTARNNSQAVSHRGRLYVLGGYDGDGLDDVWSSADGKNWTVETAAAAWSARRRHQAVSHNGRIYVMGGYDGTNRLNDVWSSADGKSWREETAAAAWPARDRHQTVSHRGRLYVLGGYGGGRLDDVWSSADGKSWREETAAAAWSARRNYQAVSRDGRLYVLGGDDDGIADKNDVWWSADGKSWTEEPAAAWSGRKEYQAVVFPSPLVLSGGGERIRLTVGMSSSNVAAFQAHYGGGAYTYSLSPVEIGFSIDNHGVLSADGNTPMGSYTLTVRVEDEEGSSAQTELPVEVALPELPLLTAFAGKMIYTLTVSGGIGEKTYAIADGDGAQYFTLGGASGKLSVRAEAEAGKYTLQVKISDSRGDYAAGAIAVEVLPPLSLAGVSLTGWARLSVAVTLHGFAASSGVGAKRYTLVAGNDAGYFVLDEISGVLSLPVNPAMLAGDYTLFLAVSDSDEPPNRATAAVKVRLAKNGIFVLGGNVGGSSILNNLRFVNDVWSAVGGKNWRQEQENNEAGRWSARRYHQAVSHQGRLYVLGGSDGDYRNDVWSSADGKSWRQEKASDEQGWSSRFRHQAVRHQGLLYVLGGYDGGYRNDVWSSADGVSWTEETSAAAWPARSNSQAVSHQGRLYVLGGYDGGYYNDVWSSVDGKSWTAEAAAAWPARSALQAVSHQGRLYVLGGYDGGYRNDVWSSADGETWRREKANDGQGWPGRFRHQVVSRDGLLYVLGGAIGTYLRNDVWSSADGRSWTKVADAAWSIRRGHQAVVFPPSLVLSGTGEVIILTQRGGGHTLTAQYGGGQYTYSLSPGVAGFDIDESSGVLSADGNAAAGGYTLTVWVEDEEGSRAQTAVEVEVRLAKDGIFVLGGWWGGSNYSNDVWWSADGESWQQGKANNSVGWPSRQLHQAVVHNGRMYVLGGNDGTRRNDVWSSADGENWQQEKANNSVGWTARDRHQAVVHNGRLYVLGGYDGAGRNDVWSSADGENWGLVTGSADWLARTQHQAVVHNGRIYVMGGFDGGYRNDVWSSADGENWDLVTGSADWPVRARHQAVVHNGRMYVLGGFDGHFLNDVWSSADGSSWRFEGNADWGGRGYHQAVSYAGRLYVLGGYGSNNYTNDVWSSADGKNWAVETAAAWSVRRGHQAVVFPSPLALVGLGEKITLTAGVAVAELHTVTAQYGDGQYTYSLSPGVTGFGIDESSGVLSADGNAAVGGYTLMVWVEDEEGSRAQTAVEVEVVDSLLLSWAKTPLLTAIARLSVTVSLHTFAAGGGYGAKRYTLIADESGYFALDAASGELSLPSNSAMLVGDYTLRVGVSDSMTPPQRATAAATVRIIKNRIFVTGGNDGQGSPYWKNDVWSSADGESWRRDKANNNVGWTRRQLHQAVAHNGRLYVMGGADGGKRKDVWWSADGASWQRETDAAWPAREIYQAVSYKGRLYVLGGFNGGKRDDVWSSADGVTWDEETGSAGWTARDRHQAVVHNGRIWLLGGQDSGGGRNDVWSSANGSSWRFEGNADWDARYFHQAVSHAGRLYVLGGASNGSTRYNDVWSSVDGRSWEQEKADNNVFWSQRYRHQSLSRDGLLYVLGGQDSGGGSSDGRKKDVWSSADGRSWTKRTDAAWTARMFHQALVFPPNLVLSGSSEVIILAAGGGGHTLTAQYGGGQYTYSLSPGVTGFGIDENSGVLSAEDNAAVGGYTLTVWVEDEEGSRAQTAVQVEVVAASTAALSAMERFAWSGSDGSRNDMGLSEHGGSWRREGRGAAFSASDAVSRIGVGRDDGSD